MSLAKAAMNKVVLEAAKRAQEPNVAVFEIAQELGVSSSVITGGKLILTYASPEEMDAVVKGKIGITTASDVVRKRMTPEQKKAFIKQGHVHSATDMELWARFKPAIDVLAEMPNVKDMIRVVSSNAGRSGYIKTNLETASDWLKEFMDGWREHQRVKSKEGATDAGNGDPTVGA